MDIRQSRGTPASSTKTAATSATATISAVTGQTVFVTDITASSDRGTAVIQVWATGSPVGTTAVIWQDRIGNAGAYSHSFVVPVQSAPSGSVMIQVDGVAYCAANIAAFQV